MHEKFLEYMARSIVLEATLGNFRKICRLDET
jgi:hypothetical protein